MHINDESTLFYGCSIWYLIHLGYLCSYISPLHYRTTTITIRSTHTTTSTTTTTTYYNYITLQNTFLYVRLHCTPLHYTALIYTTLHRNYNYTTLH